MGLWRLFAKNEIGEEYASANGYDFWHFLSTVMWSELQRSVLWRVAASLTNCYNLYKENHCPDEELSTNDR